MSGGDSPVLEVLVARGDASARHLCAAFLEDRGFAFRFAGDVPQALAACAGSLPHCVVVDEGLPPDGGLALARSLRERHGSGALGILVLGAPRGMYDQIEVLRQGADEYLRADDLTPAGLERALRAVVDRTSFRRDLRLQRRQLTRTTTDLERAVREMSWVAESSRRAHARTADEIRTQVGVIANALEMVDASGGDPEELRTLAPVMRRAVARLDHLAETLCEQIGSEPPEEEHR